MLFNLSFSQIRKFFIKFHDFGQYFDKYLTNICSIFEKNFSGFLEKNFYDLAKLIEFLQPAEPSKKSKNYLNLNLKHMTN